MNTINQKKIEIFTHAIADFSLKNNKSILISWLGGEPFLNKHVVSITENLIYSHNLFFSATTNGTKLSDESFRDHITRCYTELTVSIDGLSTFHNTTRGMVGLFEQITQYIKLLSQQAPHLKIRVNTVLMRKILTHFMIYVLSAHIWEYKRLPLIR